MLSSTTRLANLLCRKYVHVENPTDPHGVGAELKMNYPTQAELCVKVFVELTEFDRI